MVWENKEKISVCVEKEMRNREQLGGEEGGGKRDHRPVSSLSQQVINQLYF